MDGPHPPSLHPRARFVPALDISPRAGPLPMRSALALVALATAAATLWLAGEIRRNRLIWDHFDVVKPGVLYCSGQLNRDQLAAAVKSLRLRTIISFQI